MISHAEGLRGTALVVPGTAVPGGGQSPGVAAGPPAPEPKKDYRGKANACANTNRKEVRLHRGF